MKLMLISILVLLPGFAFAKACEVYGISDSPQRLICSFKSQNVDLKCVNGKYFLNSSAVSQAYHMDVESGPSPLVFETNGLQLTVEIHSKKDIRAELFQNNRSEFGKCLLKN